MWVIGIMKRFISLWISSNDDGSMMFLLYKCATQQKLKSYFAAGCIEIKHAKRLGLNNHPRLLLRNKRPLLENEGKLLFIYNSPLHSSFVIPCSIFNIPYLPQQNHSRI